jgi:protein-S-isoprenylcysteine O-methyltransferase Ste14
MFLPTVLFILAIFHASYLIQRSFRQPSSRTITTKNESSLMWLLASPLYTGLARTITLALAAYHVAISILLATPQHNNGDAILGFMCPNPQYLDKNMFSWSPQVLVTLLLLYTGSYIRLRAYAQLGANFTYRLAKPDHLVTSGLYAYVRHPSYTGIVLVLGGMYSLFLRQRGVVSCWTAGLDRRLVEEGAVGYLVPVVGFSIAMWVFLRKRVGEEEEMMEREFGQRWREYCGRTEKFIPWVC